MICNSERPPDSFDYFGCHTFRLLLAHHISPRAAPTPKCDRNRFYDFNVRTEPERVGKLRHMHRNPVSADC